jgi:hypothetical protein
MQIIAAILCVLVPMAIVLPLTNPAFRKLIHVVTSAAILAGIAGGLIAHLIYG